MITKNAVLAALIAAATTLPILSNAQAQPRAYNNAGSQLRDYTTPPSANQEPISPTGPDGLDPIDPGGNPDVPIDGGITLLAAAGLALGAKKVKDMRKARQIANI